MTLALRSPEITRRGMLAGIGGMTFYFALGTDGTRILPPADDAQRPGCPCACRCRHAAGSPLAMGADRARRQHHNSYDYRNGAGLRHVHSADDRGGNGCRLEQGDARMGAVEPRRALTAP